jgi:hypothetical protein
MMMMVQMFVAMHREFQSSVRDELKRVQKLTQELNRLNARLLQAPEVTGTDPKPEAGRPAGQSRTIPREKRPAPEAPAPRPAGRDDGAAASRPRKRGDESRQEDAPPGPKLRKEGTEVYADITRRITELQRERRGYWQRILKAING